MEKGAKMCSVSVPTPQKDSNHYMLQTQTKKTRLKAPVQIGQETLGSPGCRDRKYSGPLGAGTVLPEPMALDLHAGACLLISCFTALLSSTSVIG